METGPAWPQHAVSPKPSPNGTMLHSPLLTASPMGRHTDTTTQRKSMQCPESFLAWQLIANFSTKAESTSTFPLNMPLCLWCLALS